jgi:hypothetical protein
VLALVAACSGSGAPDFFPGPPVPHGGNAGKASGSGGSGDAAGAGDEGGAPDGTGGTIPGGAGEPATGGTAGMSATGGSTTTGGSAGLAGGAGTPSIGGAGGTAGDTATSGAGGSGGDGTGGGGGLAGSSGAGVGGADPTAGMTGTGGSVAGTAGTDGLGGMVGTGGKSGCEPTDPADEICDGIDNDCQDGIDDDGACPDGCVGATYDKHRYLLCHSEQTYTRMQAHSLCNDLGDELDVPLDLARVESEDENDFLVEFLSANPDYHLIWMSATDSMNAGSPREGSWVWGPEDRALLFYDDDEVVDGMFAYWAEGEPNDGGVLGASEDCGVFDPDRDYHWDDRVCSEETEMFLCEQLDD